MGKIVFIVHQMGTQGSYMNHLDLQQHLKDQGYDITFYCENVKRLFNVIEESRRKYTFKKGEIKILRKHIIEPYTVITDFSSLIKMYHDKIYVACDNVIVMDSVELTYHLKDMKHARFYYDIDLHEVLKCFYTNDIKFLMPPSNLKIFQQQYPDLKSEVHFKSINCNMLNTIEYENRDMYFYRWDDDEHYVKQIEHSFPRNTYQYPPEWTTLRNKTRVPLKYNEKNHIFDYKIFLYRRRKYLEYQEQFGRLIFEYILLDKAVIFLEAKPYKDDCLTDYLKHYEIEFNAGRIVTTKKELEKRMNEWNIIN